MLMMRGRIYGRMGKRQRVLPPVNTLAPVITGVPVVGQVLSCTSGTWTNSPTSYYYVWYWNAEPIEVGSTYTLIDLDIGGTITCRVSATNAGGTSGFIASNSLGPVVGVGGAEVIGSESAGFATDFTYPVDAKRVAVRVPTAGESGIDSYAVDSFYQNAGTSPKMVYNAAGMLGWSPHNLMLQSNAFNVIGASGWAGNALVLTPNAIAAPNDAMEGWAFTPPAGTVAPYVNQAPTVTSGTVVTFSIYAKNGILTPWFLIQSDTSAWFNLATGVKGTTSGSPISSNMVAVGSGWYRCDMTFIAASATPQVYLAMASSDGTGATCTTGDGVKVGFYLWGAQMNRGPVPTAYLPTTTAARVGLALDYDPVTHAARGLWSEPQATNIISTSTPPSATSLNWTIRGGLTVTQGQTDPANGTNAALVAGMAGAADCYVIGNNGLTVSANCSASFFMKKVTSSGTLRVDEPVGGNGLWDINLALLGSGWERITRLHPAVTIVEEFNGGVGGNIGLWFKEQAGGPLSFYLWGTTAENGTVATSPIPTTSATVTRAADVVKVTPASINYSATAGSWWVDLSLNAFIAGGTSRIIGNQLSSLTPIYNGSSTTFGLFDGTAAVNKTVSSAIGSNKVIAAFASGDRAFTANGLVPATDATAGAALLNPGTHIGFGTDPNPADPSNVYIRKVRYLPRRPTNAEMQTMTAPYAGTIASQAMVTSAAASTGASASFTPPANSTLIAFVSGRGGTTATATTLTDSLGSTWTKIGEYFGPQTTSFLVTGVYMLAVGPSPVAMTVTGGSTITGTNLGTGCQVISCTGSVALGNVQSGVAPTGAVTLTVSGAAALGYYVRQTTASSITIPTGYTELGGAHINFFNMTVSVVYDLSSPGNQNWTGGGNAMAWSGEISG